MKRKTAILAVMIAFTFALGGCTGGFLGKVNFGMSREEVTSAQSKLGEPTTVLNDESIMYREYVLCNTGGDLIFSFDENDALDQIMYYAYADYTTDEIEAEFLTQLQEAYPGAEDASDLEWTTTDSNVTVTVQYESGNYLIVTFVPADDSAQE